MTYSTEATNEGGRNDEAILESGGVDHAMALPKEIGGSGEGYNPEQRVTLTARLNRMRIF